jgi:MerR family transcriptional regulator, light-induced transcriptional regulator
MWVHPVKCSSKVRDPIRADSVKQPGRVRIGELGRRVGVRPETLRAWERRYALLEPDRSAGGYRLYSGADEARVRAMTALLEQGLSAAEAAQLARDSPVSPTPAVAGAPVSAPVGHPVLDREVGLLLGAIEAFDEPTANAIVDEALAAFTLQTALSALFLPALAELGAGWARGEVTVAEEHFATELLRARLLGLARGWGTGTGPLALLACPPGERHDLGLIAFGLAIREHGWRIAFLGADMPTRTIGEAAQRLDPAAVIVSAVEARRFERALPLLRELAQYHVVLIGGAGATAELARSIGGAQLAGGPVEAATWVAGEQPPDPAQSP